VNGIHDMGGMDGFGPVEPEQNEPTFHEAWEGRILAIQRSLVYGGAWHIDSSRFALESLPPQTYLRSTYYQRWVHAIENNLIANGYVSRDELQSGHAVTVTPPLKRKLTPDIVRAGLTRASFYRQEQASRLFRPGDRVRTKNIHPITHTRLPRYARDKVGTIESCHGCHLYPDSVAKGAGDDPQWLYTVVFEGRELWGENADPTIRVSIDAFQPYLELADDRL